jgi:SAM-dependent methyltransferase
MEHTDLFAEAMWQCYRTGHASVRVEREDGYWTWEDIRWYFTTARDFPAHERAVLKFARGRVLDLGCGAGRHSLYLQRSGLRVTALDRSERMVELARVRGVRDVRLTNVCGRLPFAAGEFDTVLLLGNNLGLCGTEKKFCAMLRELYRITNAQGRILASTRQPSTTNPVHRAYLQHNLERGRALGQLRLRLVYHQQTSAWFDLLLLAPTDVMRLASKSRWELTQVFPLGNFEEGYAVVLEKKKDE